MGATRVATRVAARDAWRHKGRSGLVLALISLPVLIVSVALIVLRTADLSGPEALERHLGQADALVSFDPAGPVVQDPVPFDYRWGSANRSNPGGGVRPDVLPALVGERRLVPIRVSEGGVDLADGGVELRVVEADLADPAARGLVEPLEGRLPADVGEVVVNDVLLERGVAVGQTITPVGVTGPVEVVGVVADATRRDTEIVYGLPGTFTPEVLTEDFLDKHLVELSWLLDGGKVSWDEVKELNRHGFVVASRSVVLDPPPASEVEFEHPYDESSNRSVVLLVAVMALLEVTLLAGPAFAVTARSHSRTLALIAATGGTRRQARRVVLAQAVVLGLVAGLVGVLLSLPVAALVMPSLERLGPSRFGPYEVPLLGLVAITAVGIGAALVAAAVPAWLVARQDVVAALAGRRGSPAPSRRTPVVGLVVLAVGVAGAAWSGVKYPDTSPLLLAASSALAVLGMLLVVPLVVASVARLGRRWPLPLRFAARDSDRHRGRTVPAVAAVAATVAGLVAVGIGVASNEQGEEARHRAMMVAGEGRVTGYINGYDAEGGAETSHDWQRLAEVVRSERPDLDVDVVRALSPLDWDDPEPAWELSMKGRHAVWLQSVDAVWGTDVLVDDDASVVPNLSAEQRREAEAALAAGKVVVLTDDDHAIDEMYFNLEVPGRNGFRTTERHAVPAVAFRVEHRPVATTVSAVVPTAVAGALPGDATGVREVGLRLSGAEISKQSQKAVAERLRAVDRTVGLEVERGHEPSTYTLVLVWVLGVGAALLVLVGAVTATMLALREARPDLATLAAVGAAPGLRRAVAASYAFLVVATGSVLGVLVGLVPGLAVSRPLSIWEYADPEVRGPYLEIPWLLLLGVPIGLPLLCAALMWLTTRSRLPVVARID